MSPNQLHILQHSLGCDKYGIAEHRFPRDEEYYRNHYVSQENDDLTGLVELGWMTVSKGSELSGGVDCLVYRVTPAGIAAMKVESPKPPKVSKARRRYLDFLNADLSCTFGEYLKNQWYKELT